MILASASWKPTALQPYCLTTSWSILCQNNLMPCTLIWIKKCLCQLDSFIVRSKWNKPLLSPLSISESYFIGLVISIAIYEAFYPNILDWFRNQELWHPQAFLGQSWQPVWFCQFECAESKSAICQALSDLWWPPEVIELWGRNRPI